MFTMGVDVYHGKPAVTPCDFTIGFSLCTCVVLCDWPRSLLDLWLRVCVWGVVTYQKYCSYPVPKKKEVPKEEEEGDIKWNFF